MAGFLVYKRKQDGVSFQDFDATLGKQESEVIAMNDQQVNKMEAVTI